MLNTAPQPGDINGNQVNKGSCVLAGLPAKQDADLVFGNLLIVKIDVGITL